MLSQKHLRDVCLVYDTTSAKCRYLAQDESDYSKFYCLKKSPQKSREIDVELADFVKEARKKGKDPRKENIALGDNCQGYPVLRYLEQGYDKDKP